MQTQGKRPRLQKVLKVTDSGDTSSIISHIPTKTERPCKPLKVGKTVQKAPFIRAKNYVCSDGLKVNNASNMVVAIGLFMDAVNRRKRTALNRAKVKSLKEAELMQAQERKTSNGQYYDPFNGIVPIARPNLD